MQCEVCGREIIGKLNRVIIEGAKMITCDDCAKLSSGYWTPRSEKPQKTKPKGRRGLTSPSKPIKPISETRPNVSVIEDVEVVEGFGSLIRRAREKMGLTPEELAKKIGEKESVIKKIENEKFIPDMKLAAKIEHTLKIKLLVKLQPLETRLEKPAESEKVRRSVTFGEIVRLKTGEEEGEE
ncbi:MAG: multiprotein bridging factor aMBF1 [Candidatus Bathyarchaeota archaeon]|nr:multiprotein bridging factor aMBF1 [Candidatus Bathyarchaeota archaeon]